MNAPLSMTELHRYSTDLSPRSRAQIASQLGALVEGKKLTDTERRLATDIFYRIAADAVEAVRAALSESLRASPLLPHDVAVRLAADVEAVAAPILQFSPVLTEDDLIAIVRGGLVGKQSAVAARVGLPSTVAQVICDVGETAAVQTLLRNETAAVPEAALTRSLDRWPDSAEIGQAITGRGRVPAALKERLVALASHAMQDYIAGRHDVSADIAADLILDARERAILGLVRDTTASNAYEFAKSLRAGDRLTESLVLRALCTGDADFFECALAVLARILPASAYALCRDTAGFVRLAKAAGMSPEFVVIGSAALAHAAELETQGTQGAWEARSRQLIERVLTAFEGSVQSPLAEFLLLRLGVLARRAAGSPAGGASANAVGA